MTRTKLENLTLTDTDDATYEIAVKHARDLDALAAMMEDDDLREWMFGDPESANANAYRWDEYVPTFGGEDDSGAVDGWYVLSWDEDRVLWLHPEHGPKLKERA